MEQVRIFDCPLHGMEIGVFCWRAFQKENMSRWQICNIIYERDMTEAEFQELVVDAQSP